MSAARQPSALTLEQEPFLCMRSFAGGFSSGCMGVRHAHPSPQLLYACSGAMTVHTGRFSWMIPTGKAVLIPAGCAHSIRMWGNVQMRSLYFPGEAADLGCAECRVISVTPLLRELILRIIEMGALDSRVAGERRLADVLLDEIRIAPVTPLVLPLPADERALAVARHVLADPAAADGLPHLSRRYGASRRTLERLFLNETGISFGVWRQKTRLLDSIRLLAEGKSVTDAAFDSGYSSVSAFIAAFKQTFGCTPGRL
jgi:AraC-like DNA-binding protein